MCWHRRRSWSVQRGDAACPKSTWSQATKPLEMIIKKRRRLTTLGFLPFFAPLWSLTSSFVEWTCESEDICRKKFCSTFWSKFCESHVIKGFARTLLENDWRDFTAGLTECMDTLDELDELDEWMNWMNWMNWVNWMNLMNWVNWVNWMNWMN